MTTHVTASTAAGAGAAHGVPAPRRATSAQRSALTWGLAGLGLAGSALVCYAAPRALADHVVGWWLAPAAPSGRDPSLALVYLGMAILCGAWLGLGRALPSRRGLVVIAVLWALPLALAPPLFSRDVYSYLAQGTIMHLGHNPYHSAPGVLAGLGHRHVLDAVSPFWRGTTAPYGPLFLALISLVVAAVGSHLVAGVLLTRLVELAGFVLLAVYVPRLARALGSDPRRALWLALLGPLTLLQLVCAGHNDLLMAGLLAAGVACALDGRPLLGIAVCALAATIKLPALAAVPFIAVAWARAETGHRARARFAAEAALVTAAVLVAVTLVTGAGTSWLSSSIFSTPAKVHLAITPATGVGYTAASLLNDAGVAVSARGLEDALGGAGVAVAALAGVVLLTRVRISTLIVSLGLFLAIAAVLGPAAWPWYLIWSLALLAACHGVQRSTALALALVASVFLVKPDGILALPLGSAPAVVVVYLVIVVVGWRRRRGRADRRSAMRESASSALAGT